MSEPSWTRMELVRWTADFFGQHGIASARLDAELLLAHVLETTRLDLYLTFDRLVEEPARARFRELVRRRARDRMPVAYLTGRREFWSRSFRVTEDVLIPRPETETLVRVALEQAPERVAEVGVGCGIIACALALELPAVRVIAVDLSPAALEVARENARALGLEERVELRQGDGLDGLAGPFDLVLSNPPYVSRAELEALPPEVRHEPLLALDGGADGLDLVRRLVRDAPSRLAPGGALALELGAGQAPLVEGLVREAGARAVEVHLDLAGHERVVLARF